MFLRQPGNVFPGVCAIDGRLTSYLIYDPNLDADRDRGYSTTLQFPDI
jgi:hypothetical protein